MPKKKKNPLWAKSKDKCQTGNNSGYSSDQQRTTNKIKKNQFNRKWAIKETAVQGDENTYEKKLKATHKKYAN